MARVHRFTALNAENSGEMVAVSSHKVAEQEYQPVIDWDDPQNYAPDRPIRSSRNRNPVYSESPEETRGPGISPNSGTIRRSFAHTSYIRPRRLTARRQRIITNFLQEIIDQPGKYGLSIVQWKDELMRRLREPPVSGRRTLSLISPLDLTSWLYDKEFIEIVRDLDQGRASTSAALQSQSTVGDQQDELEQTWTPPQVSAASSVCSTEIATTPPSSTSSSEEDNDGKTNDPLYIGPQAPVHHYWDADVNNFTQNRNDIDEETSSNHDDVKSEHGVVLEHVDLDWERESEVMDTDVSGQVEKHLHDDQQQEGNQNMPLTQPLLPPHSFYDNPAALAVLAQHIHAMVDVYLSFQRDDFPDDINFQVLSYLMNAVSANSNHPNASTF